MDILRTWAREIRISTNVLHRKARSRIVHLAICTTRGHFEQLDLTAYGISFGCSLRGHDCTIVVESGF
jgi:hypothetical protein